jgi:hypothetical protein
VGELDRAFDLFDGQGGEASAEFFNRLAQVVTVHYGVRQDARS